MAVFYLSPADDPVFVTQYTGINSGTYISVYEGTDVLLFASFHYSFGYQTFNNVVQVYNLGQFTQVVLDTAITAQNPYDILLSDSTLLSVTKELRLTGSKTEIYFMPQACLVSRIIFPI